MFYEFLLLAIRLMTSPKLFADLVAFNNLNFEYLLGFSNLGGSLIDYIKKICVFINSMSR